MKKERHVRNLNIAGKQLLCWDLAVLAALAVAADLMLPYSGPIGARTMGVLWAADAIGTLLLMCALEKYRSAVSAFYEKCVITVLSSVYAWLLLGLVNLLFFTSEPKFLADSMLLVIKIVAVILVDYGYEKLSSLLYEKPRLLILDSKDENFFRMKRMKYHMLRDYDSWYENTSGYDLERFRRFVRERFPAFDSICVLDGLSEEEYSIALHAAVEQQKDLFVVPKLIDVGKTNAKPVPFGDVLTLYMPKISLSRVELAVKRLFDVLLSLAALVIAGLPMLGIALAIRLSSPGPVFYKQVRLTKDKKPFEIYKFRTMVPDAEKESGPKFAEKNDPRVTPIGRFLRASRLDELPQLFNILKGDMSIVGPRPERPVFVERFEKEIENYDYRFQVRAGLTSLSHVYGRYSTYIHDRTFYDLFYITHYSFWLDLKIMLLTTKILFLKAASEGEDDFKMKTIAKPVEESVKK